MTFFSQVVGVANFLGWYYLFGSHHKYRYNAFEMERQFISIGVMGGTAIAKYRDLQLGCCETWVQQCHKVYFFCGNHHEPTFEMEMNKLTSNKAQFVHLEDVGEDYESASYKHWIGLAYMMENEPANWYAIFGSDNYIRHDRLVETLIQYDHELPLIVGGTIQCRTLDMQVPFNIGGGGSYITHKALKMILNQWDGTPMEQARKLCLEWVKLCEKCKVDLKPACDVALGYYGWNLDIPIVGIRGFFPIDWTGHQYYGHIGAIFSFKRESIIVCHFMNRPMMLSYHNFLGYKPHIHSLTPEDSISYVKIKFNQLSIIPSYISEHVSILDRYARECQSITEIGLASSMVIPHNDNVQWIFLHALKSGGELTFVGDSEFTSEDELKIISKDLGIKFNWIEVDGSRVSIDGMTDLLFINSWDIEGHIQLLLQLHHTKVNKYIILHYNLASSDKYNFELVNGQNITKYNHREVNNGIWGAINKFIETHYDKWELVDHFDNCGQLTIIKRI